MEQTKRGPFSYVFEAGNGADAPAAPAAGAPPLPCLNENKCTRSSAKSGQALQSQVEGMALSVGIGKLALLTVTTADNCTDPKVFQKRWRKFHRGVKGFFPFGTWAREPQKRGAWHAHCVVPMNEDVRTGFDFKAYHLAREASKRKDRRALREHTKAYAKSAHPCLQKLWPALRRESKRSGFGRVELVPVEDASHLGKYLSEYLSESMGERPEHEKGVRLWGIWGKRRWASTLFAWNGPGGLLRRRKLAVLQEILGLKYEEFAEYFGRRWSHKINQLLDVLLIRFEDYPKLDRYMQDLRGWRTDKNGFASRQLVIRSACAMSLRYAKHCTKHSVGETFGLNARSS